MNATNGHDEPGAAAAVTAARRSPSPAAVCDGQVDLPTVVEELLVDVVADGFVLYCCGPKAAPNALVACYEWEHCVDLVTIRDFERVTTARVPARDSGVDIFAPDVVIWSYEGPPQQALRALLDLVHPAHPDAPTADYPAPATLHIPRAQQRPMTIRLPSPGQARVRAARLSTAMTTHGGDRAVSAVVPAGAREALHRQRPLGHLPNPEVTPTMPTRPRPTFDPWGDIDGAPIPQQCRIEQVDVDKKFGALPSRLHRRGQVLGRGTTRLIVRFDDNAVARIRPHLVRVLTAPDGC